MNYRDCYERLVAVHGSLKCPLEGHHERHYVVPGEKEYVYMSARVHLIAHRLLARIYDTTQAAEAYLAMSMDRGKTMNSRQYASRREWDNLTFTRRVHTPKGWFESAKTAAFTTGVSKNVIASKVRSKHWLHREYYYEAITPKHNDSARGLQFSKRVHTPSGWFDSVRGAAALLGLHHRTVGRYVKSSDHPEWFFEDACAVNPVQVSRKVHTPEGWFASAKDAATVMGLSGPSVVTSRIKANETGYYYFSDKFRDLV